MKAVAVGRGLRPFLRAVLDAPDADGPRLAFADWLDERGPTPVRLGHLPNWLRVSWLRRTRPFPKAVAKAAGFRRFTNIGSVAAEIDGALATVLGGHRLEHWGST